MLRYHTMIKKWPGCTQIVSWRSNTRKPPWSRPTIPMRAAGLLAPCTVAEAYGGLGTAANGNQILKTLRTVLKAVGMKLSVEPERRVAA